MTDIAIQFHATASEIVELVQSAVIDFDLHVVAMRFGPFEAVEMDANSLNQLASKDSPFRELALTVDVPKLPVASNMKFLDKNLGALRVLIEHPSEEGLRQALLSTRVRDPKALAVWRKIAGRLKKMTKPGVIVVN